MVQGQAVEGGVATKDRQTRGKWYHHWLLPLAVFAFGWLVAAWCFQPPAPEPATAALDSFSAERAQRLLQEVFGDEQPHPVGSARNAEVRQRLLKELRTLGLKPQVQRGYACRGVNVCSEVHNVVAVIEGTAAKREALLLNAHYDSVPAGPGIGDDASGVAAALEVARALLAGSRLQHDVVLLLDDGEEAGLLGARAFMSDHPLSRRVRAVVNLEARGSGGPSLMFESEGHSDTLMEVLSEVERPLTSSLFVAVYKRLPNDTNFTVFRQYGVAGFNLAFIDEVAHYHTPLDNISNTSPASLQHHGDNALQLLRGLDHTDLTALAAGGGVRRVWFDWLGMTLNSMPVHWARGLAVGLLVVLLFVVAVWSWSAERRLSCIVKTLLGFWVMMVLPTLALAVMVELAKAMKGTQTPWMGYSLPYMLVLITIAAASVMLVGRWLRVARGWLVYALIWSQWAVLGVVVAEWAPAAAHLLLVPTSAAAVCALVGVFARREERTWAGRLLLLLPVVVTVTVWGRVTVGVMQVAGLWLYPVVALTFLMPLTTALPALASQPPRQPKRCIWGATGLAAAAALIGLALPAFSADAPQRMSILHLQRDSDQGDSDQGDSDQGDSDQGDSDQGDSGEAMWLVDTSWGRLPDELVELASLGASEPAPLPNMGMQRVAFGRAAAAAVAPGVRVKLTAVEQRERGTRRTLRLVSPRQNHTMMLLFPEDVTVQRMQIDGHPIGLAALDGEGMWRGYRIAMYLSVAAAGAELQVDLPRGAPLNFEVLDVTPGLPSMAAPLLMARGTRAVASQHGDLSIVSTKVNFASDAKPNGEAAGSE